MIEPEIIDVAPVITPGMAVIGTIDTLSPIEKADRLEAARVECGKFGSWRAVVVKGAFGVGDRAVVFMPDAILPAVPCFEFMAKYHYRVKLQKLRGAPSEVLAMPLVDVAEHAIKQNGVDLPFMSEVQLQAFTDVTVLMGVTKYQKNLSPEMRGVAKGSLPAFIKKTDEVNFQKARDVMALLRAVPVSITVKCDGSSFTAFKHGEHSGVCSRNLELKEEAGGAFWAVAKKYGLPEALPDGYALQAEMVGPGIQGNPMNLESVELRAFDLIEIGVGYAPLDRLRAVCGDLAIPLAPLVWTNHLLSATNLDTDDGLQALAAAVSYPGAGQAEGIVIRSMDPTLTTPDGDRLSVKVINLNYKERE